MLLFGTEAAGLKSVCYLELRSTDGIVPGLPPYGVGPTFVIFHAYLGSFLTLRERDLDL